MCMTGYGDFCQDPICPNQKCPQSDVCKPLAIKWVCPTGNQTHYYPNSAACSSSDSCKLGPGEDCCYPVNAAGNLTNDVCGKISSGPYAGKQCTPDGVLGPGGSGIHGGGYECRNGGEFNCLVFAPECQIGDCDLCTSDCDNCTKEENVVKICRPLYDSLYSVATHTKPPKWW